MNSSDDNDPCYDDRSSESLFNIPYKAARFMSQMEDTLQKSIRKKLDSSALIEDEEEEDVTLSTERREPVHTPIQPHITDTFRMDFQSTGKRKLLRIEVALICPLIEESIQKLRILTRKCPKVNVKFDFLDIFERFVVKRKKTMTIKRREDLAIREKFTEDLERLLKIMKMIKDDLHFEDHFFLNTYIGTHKMKLLQIKNIICACKTLSQSLTSLKDDIEYLHAMAERSRKNVPVITLHRQEVRDETAIKLGRLVEYLKKYDQSRIYQNRLRIEKNLNLKLSEIETKQKKIADEELAHEDIMKYCKKSLMGLEADIEHWEKKYIKDMEDIGLKMDMVDEELGENSSTLQLKLSQFDQRKLQLSIYEGEKEEIFKKDMLDYLMDKVIASAQGWFRGTMVRWELGPYAPAEAKRRSVTPKPKENESSSSSSSTKSEEEDEFMVPSGPPTEASNPP